MHNPQPRILIFHHSLSSIPGDSPPENDMDSGGGGVETHLHDLPDPVLTSTLSMVSDVRTRNSMSLVCRKWRSIERSTRTSLSLRGDSMSLSVLPAATTFPSILHLDLSSLSPWGAALAGDDEAQFAGGEICRAFPSPSSIVLYARTPAISAALAQIWSSSITSVKLVRWHRRPPDLPHGADLLPIFSSCPNLTSLDLSSFYCWTEDIPAALAAPICPNLTSLNLLSAAASDGFRSTEITDIAAACPLLLHLLAPCAFNPRYIDPVGDAALAGLAASCRRLTYLHLADPFAVSPSTAPPVSRGADGFSPEDAGITCKGLETFFSFLPDLEHLALEICHNVRDAGPAMEVMSYKCPRMETLKLGGFHGVCRAAGLHLDGIAVCGGLRSLSVCNSVGFTDSSMAAVARGCRKLEVFEIKGCDEVTGAGLRKLAGALKGTLVDVKVSGCRSLDARRTIRALEPIRGRLERLHLDCVWGSASSDSDSGSEKDDSGDDDEPPRKKRRSDPELSKAWGRLKWLSLWFAAGELLWPLAAAGLEDCPELEEVMIKVEGDCRTRPEQRVFGLSSLSRFGRLRKMELDCGEAAGNAFTAPTGQMDLSFWERFHLQGIGELSGLRELDYWPPQDREVNQRTVSLPAAGLVQGCLGLRKLFIHGTAHEHFMRFFLRMPNLRDVQLREDYYPAPEDDMSTEMRIESCRRFEAALDRRPVPD